jgi:hypothetical protein
VRFVTWSNASEPARAGVLIDGDTRIVDLAAAYEARHGGAAPASLTSILSLIQGGEDALAQAREMLANPAGSGWFPILLVFVFDLFDMAGRALPNFTRWVPLLSTKALFIGIAWFCIFIRVLSYAASFIATIIVTTIGSSIIDYYLPVLL